MANESSLGSIEKEMTAIRRLLVFALIKSGASQDEVAAALGVSQSSISKMFPNVKKSGRTRKHRR